MGDEEYEDGYEEGNGSRSFLHRASPIASAIDEVRDKGLAGVTADAIKEDVSDYVSDKADELREAAKDKIQEKKKEHDDKKQEKKKERDEKKKERDEKKKEKRDERKKKLDDKLPDSVKKKRDALKDKSDALKGKLGDAKKKLKDAKEGFDDFKKNLNEKAFKKGAKAAANLTAPGTGKAVEALINSPKGEKAVKAAREASNPIKAIEAGTEKLVKVIIRDTIIKNLLLKVLPVLAGVFLIFLIITVITSKFSNHFAFFEGGLGDETSELDEDYRAFYKNIDKYAGNNKEMVVAVLTAYKEEEEYLSDEDNNSEEDSCTQEEIDNGDCVIESESSGSVKYSKAKMKKYIKKVSKKIGESTNGIDEGDYENRETGSDFFWWLYDDFVNDYYSEYLNSTDEATILDKKKEIISYIYIYYKDLKQEGTKNYSLISSRCPNGVTLTPAPAGYKFFDDHNTYPIGTFSLEEYVAMVLNGENVSKYDESMKAQIVAARTFVLAQTNNCTKPMENSDRKQVAKANPSQHLIDLVNETSGEVLTYNGDIFLSQYDSFKGTCNETTCSGVYTRLPDETTHIVSYPKDFESNAGGHGRGMSQVASNYLGSQGWDYEKILKYFYSDGVEISKMGIPSGDFLQLGTEGIYSTSIFPIDTELKNVHLTQGYLYDNGSAHGAIDLFCTAAQVPASMTLKKFCNSLKIISAHSGVVTNVVRNQYCASTKYYNNDTSLPRSSSCIGNGVDITVTDRNDPYYGYKFRYWHFNEIDENIKVGARVETGQFLGYMGSTGRSTGWHLHFEIRNARGEKLNQNDNILKFVQTYGLRSDGILATNAGPKF